MEDHGPSLGHRNDSDTNYRAGQWDGDGDSVGVRVGVGVGAGVGVGGAHGMVESKGLRKTGARTKKRGRDSPGAGPCPLDDTPDTKRCMGAQGLVLGQEAPPMQMGHHGPSDPALHGDPAHHVHPEEGCVPGRDAIPGRRGGAGGSPLHSESLGGVCDVGTETPRHVGVGGLGDLAPPPPPPPPPEHPDIYAQLATATAPLWLDTPLECLGHPFTFVAVVALPNQPTRPTAPTFAYCPLTRIDKTPTKAHTPALVGKPLSPDHTQALLTKQLTDHPFVGLLNIDLLDALCAFLATVPSFGPLHIWTSWTRVSPRSPGAPHPGPLLSFEGRLGALDRLQTRSRLQAVVVDVQIVLLPPSTLEDEGGARGPQAWGVTVAVIVPCEQVGRLQVARDAFFALLASSVDTKAQALPDAAPDRLRDVSRRLLLHFEACLATVACRVSPPPMQAQGPTGAGGPQVVPGPLTPTALDGCLVSHEEMPRGCLGEQPTSAAMLPAGAIEVSRALAHTCAMSISTSAFHTSNGVIWDNHKTKATLSLDLGRGWPCLTPPRILCTVPIDVMAEA